MVRRGRKRRLAVEDEYWRLIGSGMGTVEACRRVGIGRHTGYRWRAERGGMPLARLMRDVSGRYLSLLERERIAALRRMGLGVRAIARELGRSASTVSRELKRNARPHDYGVYDAVLAHTRAQEKACRVKIPILARDSELRDQKWPGEIGQPRNSTLLLPLMEQNQLLEVDRLPTRTAAAVPTPEDGLQEQHRLGQCQAGRWAFGSRRSRVRKA